MTRYSHALTVAYEVESGDPDMPTLAEAIAGLKNRLADLEANPREAEEALLGERPFDTYVIGAEAVIATRSTED